MKTVLLPKLFQPFACSNLIRLGKENDGGYLLNRSDVSKTNLLLSFGLGHDTSFEMDFQRLNCCNIIAYDSSIEQIENNIIQHKKENVTCVNISRILYNDDNIFLKCDIDGGEYEILYDILINSHKFTGVVIEFHGMSNFSLFNEITNFICKFELRLIHIHINNYSYIETENGYIPDVIELTFSSSRDNTYISKEIQLPNLLDMPNNPSEEDFKVIFDIKGD